MPVDGRLWNAAEHIYNYLITELPAAGIDLPDRRFLHAGNIAQDVLGIQSCAEQFIVSWQAALPGQIGATAGGAIPTVAIRCAMPLSHTFLIALYRCVPVLREDGRPPTVESLNAAAEKVMNDGMTLCRVIVDGTLAGDLQEERVDLVGLGVTPAVGPAGGLGGVHVNLAVSIL